MDNPDEKQKHSFNPVRGPTPRPIRAYELPGLHESPSVVWQEVQEISKMKGKAWQARTG